MRYMKDIIIDSRHLMTKVNLYLIISFHSIYIVYYINLTNQIMYVTCYYFDGKKSYCEMEINEVRSDWVLLVTQLIITFG